MQSRADGAIDSIEEKHE